MCIRDRVYQLRRVLKDWVEGEATWNTARSGLAWSTPGAKGVGSDIDTTVAANGSTGWDPGWVNFDVTTSVASMSAGTANYGWKLQPVSGTLALKSYVSRENVTASQRPKLFITYTQGGNQLPTVAITSPASGASYVAPASVVVSA